MYQPGDFTYDAAARLVGDRVIGPALRFVRRRLEDGERALVLGHTDEERVVYLADSLTGQPLRVGQVLRVPL